MSILSFAEYYSSWTISGKLAINEFPRRKGIAFRSEGVWTSTALHSSVKSPVIFFWRITTKRRFLVLTAIPTVGLLSFITRNSTVPPPLIAVQNARPSVLVSGCEEFTCSSRRCDGKCSLCSLFSIGVEFFQFGNACDLFFDFCRLVG